MKCELNMAIAQASRSIGPVLLDVMVVAGDQEFDLVFAKQAVWRFVGYPGIPALGGGPDFDFLVPYLDWALSYFVRHLAGHESCGAGEDPQSAVVKFDTDPEGSFGKLLGHYEEQWRLLGGVATGVVLGEVSTLETQVGITIAPSEEAPEPLSGTFGWMPMLRRITTIDGEEVAIATCLKTPSMVGTRFRQWNGQFQSSKPHSTVWSAVGDKLTFINQWAAVGVTAGFRVFSPDEPVGEAPAKPTVKPPPQWLDYSDAMSLMNTGPDVIFESSTARLFRVVCSQLQVLGDAGWAAVDVASYPIELPVVFALKYRKLAVAGWTQTLAYYQALKAVHGSWVGTK